MSARARLRMGCLLLGASLLAGCYSYTAIERPTPGTQLRVHVPVRSGIQSVDRGETVSFEGRVLAFGDSLFLETRSRREFGAFREVFELDTLRLDPGRLAGMEERVYSPGKTYAFTAVVTAGAAGLVVAALKAAGGGDENGGPGNGTTLPSTIIKPVFSALAKLLGR